MRAALLMVVLAGCTLFDGDPPDRSCRTDSDCFRAQGESCTAAKVCAVGPDGGVGVDAASAAPAPVRPGAAEVSR